MPVTLQDIAREVGVTPSTVSYALSGKGTLSTATRARIITCAQSLGYRPNLVARGLVMQRTQTIGLLVGDIANPFYGAVTQTVERTAYRAGYRVFFGNTDRDEQLGQSLLDDLAARRVDGIIAMPGGLPLQTVRSATVTGRPVVWCLWEDDQHMTPSVDLDYYSGGLLAAEHLTALGHRRVGIVAHEPRPGNPAPEHQSRVAGCSAGLIAGGCIPGDVLLAFGNSTIESGRAAGRALLTRPSPPTAIFATNDLMALGILGAAHDLSIPVPGMLSIVGFDDIFVTDWTCPPLTSIHVDIPTIMTGATTLLLGLIEGKEIVMPPMSTPRLVVRGSTGPCAETAHR